MKISLSFFVHKQARAATFLATGQVMLSQQSFTVEASELSREARAILLEYHGDEILQETSHAGVLLRKLPQNEFYGVDMVGADAAFANQLLYGYAKWREELNRP